MFLKNYEMSFSGGMRAMEKDGKGCVEGFG